MELEGIRKKYFIVMHIYNGHADRRAFRDRILIVIPQVTIRMPPRITSRYTVRQTERLLDTSLQVREFLELEKRRHYSVAVGEGVMQLILETSVDSRRVHDVKDANGQRECRSFNTSGNKDGSLVSEALLRFVAGGERRRREYFTEDGCPSLQVFLFLRLPAELAIDGMAYDRPLVLGRPVSLPHFLHMEEREKNTRLRRSKLAMLGRIISIHASGIEFSALHSVS